MTRSANLGFNLTAQVRAAAGYIARRRHSGTVEPALSPPQYLQEHSMTSAMYTQSVPVFSWKGKRRALPIWMRF